uniref:BACK domain-containing protein n=1 Tax=Panagrolaimus davidi TaxID=227884 RepID=A0A914P1R9_9BILA
MKNEKLICLVFEWAKNECHRKNERFPTPEDIQEIMLPLMPYFYLSKLHPLTMATIIKTNKLIPDEQLINYLAQHLVETFERPCCGRPFCHRGGRGGGGGGEHADLRSLPPRGGRGRGGYI